MKVLTSNKKAYFNFDIIEKFEAGIQLEGWEVKSIKGGRFDISSAYIKIDKSGINLINSNVPSWKSGEIKKPEILNKNRRLLLHKNQIKKLDSLVAQSGVTLIPLEVYQNDKGLIKVEVALVKGKKKYDKRKQLKDKDLKRRVDLDRKKYNF